MSHLLFDLIIIIKKWEILRSLASKNQKFGRLHCSSWWVGGINTKSSWYPVEAAWLSWQKAGRSNTGCYFGDEISIRISRNRIGAIGNKSSSNCWVYRFRPIWNCLAFNTIVSLNKCKGPKSVALRVDCFYTIISITPNSRASNSRLIAGLSETSLFCRSAISVWISKSGVVAYTWPSIKVKGMFF